MQFALVQSFAALGAGFASVVSPCVLPILPIIVTGTHRDDRWRPLLLVIGLSITFVVMGIISSLFGSFLMGRIQYIEKVGGGIILLFGILTLLNINLFKSVRWFAGIQVRPDGKWSGLWIGMSLGLVWIPCIGPFLSGVLTMVASQGQLSSGITLLLIYSVGFSVPILATGYFSHWSRARLPGLHEREWIARYITGAILVLFGAYIIFIGSLPRFYS
ncbi:cytochrome c biogenesis CcdA family protein [Leptonema illini]|uniref:Cytochrome c biogenesis protein transmembrane region n=1 Tax=Leptonema illini DSM 21528 TaxID=929563 RepID=H2CCU1_9LEPT|nr:cytochrome c biogenesis CcdA family protein [Leptonema illini]EHQ05382.1 cytochrome c biogenesis protein transmembrane region [Leptonema illini DSM 21528]